MVQSDALVQQVLISVSLLVLFLPLPDLLLHLTLVELLQDVSELLPRGAGLGRVLLPYSGGDAVEVVEDPDVRNYGLLQLLGRILL